MRWFSQHPKLTILKQITREQQVLPRIPKIVIIELDEEGINKVNEFIRTDLDERGGTSILSKLKRSGASDSHKGKFIGLDNNVAGILVTTPPKRLKKEGWVCGIFEAIKKIYKDRTLHKLLDKCSYAIVLNNNLLERYGKKYPVNLVGRDAIKSPDNYTAGWCWVLVHEFVHIIEIENKKPIFECFSNTERGAEITLSKHLPFKYWEIIEPMKNNG